MPMTTIADANDCAHNLRSTKAFPHFLPFPPFLPSPPYFLSLALPTRPSW